MFERVRNPLSFFRKASSQTPKAGGIPRSQKETELRIGKPLRTKDSYAFSLLFPFLWGTGFGKNGHLDSLVPPASSTFLREFE